ncbi:MAG: Spy/CpxP family protein refolding chaperone [Cyanobacteria bacterium P01_C01_bin.89]
MFNRKFPLIAAGSLLAGATLAYLPHLGLGLDATANSTAGDAQIESAEPTYLAQSDPAAEDARGGRGRRGNGPGWLRELNLTEAQQTQMQAIKEKYRPQMEQQRAEGKAAKDQMRQLMSNPNTSNDQLRSQHQKLQQLRQSKGNLRFESMLEMRTVLTPEQRQQMAQRMAEREERRGGRGGGRARGERRGDGPGAAPQSGNL